MIAVIWFLTIILAAGKGPFETAMVLTGYWILITCKPSIHHLAIKQIKEPGFYAQWNKNPVKDFIEFAHKLVSMHYYISNEFVIIFTGGKR